MAPEEDGLIPKFKTYAEGEAIPPVDPEDIKRTLEYDRTHSKVGSNGCEWLRERKAVCSPAADVDDVSLRCHMIETLVRYDHGKLLAPWKHGDEPDDTVLGIAATFPLQFVTHHDYQMPGDYLFPFDVNAFVRQLVDETGVQHSWQEVPTRISEGRCFTMFTISDNRDTDGNAKRKTRALLWAIWERCNDLSTVGKDHPEVAAGWFADFVIDNLELVQKLEEGIRTQHLPPISTLQEAEEKAAQWRP